MVPLWLLIGLAEPIYLRDFSASVSPQSDPAVTTSSRLGKTRADTAENNKN
jgi:hypothetical protein